MTAQQIVDLLNEAVLLDRDGIYELMKQRAPINDALLDHPTIQCWGRDESSDGVARFGPLGLLNGIAAIDGELIEMVIDTETRKLVGFRLRVQSPAVIEG